MSDTPTHLLAVGSRGLELRVPGGVTLFPVASPVEPGPALFDVQQRELVVQALAQPACGAALKELVRGKQRAAVLVGDLAHPAPYEHVLPPVLEVLLEAGIRPGRTTLLAWPGGNGPLLGRAAISRYGEEQAGQYELKPWQPGENGLDPYCAASDCRLAVLPAGVTPPSSLKLDAQLALTLGKKARIDVVSAALLSGSSLCAESPVVGTSAGAAAAPVACDVYFTSGGGADWEQTLEEALISLRGLARRVTAKRVVLAFSGESGLGSAHFTLDTWDLLQQAGEVLAEGGSLDAGGAEHNAGGGAAEQFDPALTLAEVLGGCEKLILFAPGLAEHEDSGELAERLEAFPALAERLCYCDTQEEVWEVLARSGGDNYSLLLEPLGWRASGAGAVKA